MESIEKTPAAAGLDGRRTGDAVVAEHLTKKYTIYQGQRDRLASLLLPGRRGEEVTALDDLSFTFRHGEIIGLIGLNGSGKSTLSNIISGISTQTSGSLQVNGSVSMLSAASGMSPHLSGRENITYKCVLLGMSAERIREIEPSIIDFADIGMYIDQPLRTYSSGMRSRLGFAISAHLEPDILVVDEALAVGDASFTQKCIQRMNEFRAKGRTIIFVSHAKGAMEGFCERVMWLHRGRMIGFGNTDEILGPYQEFAREWSRIPQNKRADFIPSMKK